MLVAVEGGEAVDELPDFGDVGVEDVGAVFVNLDAGFGIDFTTDIAADYGALFENENALASFGKATGDGAAPDACAGNDGIKLILLIHVMRSN